METNQKTYTDFEEWKAVYLAWIESMPRYYNYKFLAMTGIFCNDGSLNEIDAKEFMFANVIEVDNMDEDMMKFAFITMIEEWESQLNQLVSEKKLKNPYIK